MVQRFLFLFLIWTACGQVSAQSLYFPPLNNNLPWDTIHPASLGWCTNRIDTLYNFLEQENTKAFILLKDGKIVMEKYFGSFTKDSIWYWASAGKTITAFLVGKAREDGFLNLNDSTSRYLGTGWTACTPAQEGKIRIRHQLAMTSGLDDRVPDNHCTLDTCLRYLAAPDTRWAYHNAPYTLLEQVLEKATGSPVNQYTTNKLKSATGMTGLWQTTGYDNVFFSRARSMARYGLLALNGFVWNRDTLLSDRSYAAQMVNTSQNINKSYGYLWWLNGKSSYMLPTLQTVFPGSWAPSAPADMFAGLGKNAQLLCVVPSKGLVMVRMGNEPNSPASEVPTIFCNQIWQLLNSIMCNTTATDDLPVSDNTVQVYPNPASGSVTVRLNGQRFALDLYDLSGRLLLHRTACDGEAAVDVAGLQPGCYIVAVKGGDGNRYFRKLLVE